MTKKEPRKAIVEILHLKKSFGTQEILKDVSLNLFPQENLVILGKSGSGKSVLIKCIVKLLFPDSGTILVQDEDINRVNDGRLAAIRKTIGFLFQSGALYDSITVRQNLEFPLKRMQKKLTQKSIDEKVQEVLEQVGLPDVADKMPSELSGGMRKRISLARTVIVSPKIMLYDEPTTGLDPATSSEISALINSVQEKYQTSSIIITHDIECARTTADRAIMLNNGVVHKEGLLAEFESSEDPLLKVFFKGSLV